MEQICYGCGSYPDADWMICSHCKRSQLEEMWGEPVFIDGLVIAWTQSDLQEAGGVHEVMKMTADADVRNNLTR
jgi:hypothetical protein